MKVKVEHKDKTTIIRMSGMINEDCELSLDKLQSVGGNTVVFDFKDVLSVNSCGLRAWINFLRKFEENKEIYFRHCTPDIVNQLNMIPSFQGSAKIESLYGEYFCENCKIEQLVLYREGENMPDDVDNIDAVLCKNCGNETEMLELDEEYFDCVMGA